MLDRQKWNDGFDIGTEVPRITSPNEVVSPLDKHWNILRNSCQSILINKWFQQLIGRNLIVHVHVYHYYLSIFLPVEQYKLKNWCSNSVTQVWTMKASECGSSASMWHSLSHLWEQQKWKIIHGSKKPCCCCTPNVENQSKKSQLKPSYIYPLVTLRQQMVIYSSCWGFNIDLLSVSSEASMWEPKGLFPVFDPSLCTNWVLSIECCALLCCLQCTIPHHTSFYHSDPYPKKGNNRSRWWNMNEESFEW